MSYTLSGGLGILAREFGYAADHVRSLDVVTADGQLRRVTRESEPDLYWALLGAGHAFGVVTELEIELVPVRTLYIPRPCCGRTRSGRGPCRTS